jgi:hypothetical protein
MLPLISLASLFDVLLPRAIFAAAATVFILGVYYGIKYVGMMKTIYLAFEFLLTVLWYWATWWQLSIMGSPTSDYGTWVGAFLFFAFAVGTTWMLCHEVVTTARNQFHIELNLFRRLRLGEKLAARMGEPEPQAAPKPYEIPLNMPEE